MKPPAVIFDRDGTLFSVKHHMAPRTTYLDYGADGPTDWASYNGLCAFDAPVPLVAALFQAVRPGVIKIITSGRMDSTRRDMMAAMRKHNLVPDFLFMRADKDQRKDSLVKAEIFHRDIEPYFDVRYVVDDRPQVVDMWRDLGLPVMAVRDPGVLPNILTQSG